MKLLLPLFLYTFLLSTNLVSQNKLGQVAYAQWDREEGQWIYYSFDSWAYDEFGQEKIFKHIDTRYSDYTPTNNTHTNSKYNSEGKLIEQNILNYGPNQWENILLKNSYHSNGELIEELRTKTTSYNDYVQSYKVVYEHDVIENRRSKKNYFKADAGQFILTNQFDTVFNDQNCLIETSSYTYNPDGSIRFGHKLNKEYTNECLLLQSDSYRWDVNLESMKIDRRNVYEYFNDGKLMITTYLEFTGGTNQWETEHFAETEFNDAGEITRYFLESYRYNSIDTTLQLYSYTSRDEIETFQQYETINTTEGKYFRRTRKDSFSYHYNLQDQVILEEEYNQNYDHAVMKNVITYDYYCNGQLKSEVREQETPYFRADYRYVGGVDCPLDEEDGVLMLFPNPTLGVFTIQANFLAKPETTIQVFTLLGQEVFYEKINQTSFQYQIDLSNFERGNYIVMVSNSEGRLSEKLVVF